MDVIFLKLLNMSIASIWLISAVLLLRIFLKKAPKWANCILWGITALRLIFPFYLNAPFSLIPSAETFNRDVIQFAQNPTINTGIPVLNCAVNPIISKAFAPNPGASVNPLYIWIFIAGMIWAVGTALLLSYALFRYVRLYRTVQEAIPLSQSSIFHQDKKEIPLWLCDAVKSPFVFGLIKPGIYLPSGIDKGQMQHVIAHEQAHLQRKDHWWKLLGYFLLAIHWFNPMVWAAYFLFCRDMELACDEKVICRLDMAGRKAYAHALVSCSMQKNMVMVCPLAFGEVDVKERVKAILKYKKPAFPMIVAAVVVCVLTAVCFLTNPLSTTFNGDRIGNDSEFMME